MTCRHCQHSSTSQTTSRVDDNTNASTSTCLNVNHTTSRIDHDHDDWHNDHTTSRVNHDYDNWHNDHTSDTTPHALTKTTTPHVNDDDEGGVWAVVPSPLKGVLFFHYLLIFTDFILTSLTVNATRRISSSSTFSTKVSRTRQARNHTLVGVISCLTCFLCPTIRRAHNHTFSWCAFVLGVFVSPSYTMPNTKRHQQGCLFVVGIFTMALPLPSTKPYQRRCDFMSGIFSSSVHIRQTRNDTLVGVIS